MSAGFGPLAVRGGAKHVDRLRSVGALSLQALDGTYSLPSLFAAVLAASISSRTVPSVQLALKKLR